MIQFSRITQTKERNNLLLDVVIKEMHLKNDAALSRLLGVAPPVISKLRSFKLPVGATLAIRIHEETGFSIEQIKGFMDQEGGAA